MALERCALCLQHCELLESHIVPKFAWTCSMITLMAASTGRMRPAWSPWPAQAA